MQPLLLQDLRARIAAAGLSQHESALLPHARLAFDLQLDGESSGETGESRWGGAPDVPEGFRWPHTGVFPMGFVAQVNLADLIEDDENPFPPRGLLQFFATYDVPHVILVDASLPLQPADVPEKETDWGEMAGHRLKITPRADLPQWATRDYIELTESMSEEEQNAYNDAFNVTERPKKDDFAGQLLGHAAGIGEDPRQYAFQDRELGGGSFHSGDAEHQSGVKRWLNLATFDSIDSIDFMIGDAGYFVFLAHQDDLARLDFSRAYALVQSS